MAVNSFLTALWTMEVKTQGRMQLDLKALVQRVKTREIAVKTQGKVAKTQGRMQLDLKALVQGVPDELAVGPGPVAREDPGH